MTGSERMEQKILIWVARADLFIVNALNVLKIALPIMVGLGIGALIGRARR